MGDLASMFIPDKPPVPAQRPSLFMAEPDAPGLIEPGNLNLLYRPIVRNPDGSVSTVRSMSFEEDGREVLIPTISQSGASLTPEGAMALYRNTGSHLGKFYDPAAADAYAQALHRQQEQFYSGAK